MEASRIFNTFTNDYISPLINCLIKDPNQNLLVSPLIAKMILDDNLDFFRNNSNFGSSIFGQPLNKRSYFKIGYHSNFILRCKAVIKEILNSRNSIFYTTHEDRMVISRSIKILLSEYPVKDPSNKKLNRVIHRLESLSLVIQNCESIKKKHLVPHLHFLQLPVDVQKYIYSYSPIYWRNHNDFFDKLKHIYNTYFELSIFYKDIIPSLLNYRKRNFFWLNANLSIIEIMEMTPHFQSMDTLGGEILLPKILQVMRINELKSVQSLRIDGKILRTLMNNIEDLSHLKELRIYKHHSPQIFLSSKNIIKLQSLVNLTTLELKSFHPSAIEHLVETISKMPNLQNLSVGIWLNSQYTKLLQLKAFEHLKNFKCIVFKGHHEIDAEAIQEFLHPLNVNILIGVPYL